jgi:NADH:ubiquinone oxidoreductase subunit E
MPDGIVHICAKSTRGGLMSTHTVPTETGTNTSLPRIPDVTEESVQSLETYINNVKDQDGMLIPVLQKTQDLYGYLPKDALVAISRIMKLPYSEVAGVVGFYSYFTTVPRGKHIVRVCLGTACYVRGGQEVMDSLKKNLEIEVGGTTEDRNFSLEAGRCFGACGLAPVVMVDDDVHQRVNPSRVKEVLSEYTENSTED